MGLKCIGPRRVDEGLVLGTEACPNKATISLENGVFRERAGGVGIKFRCIKCNSRYLFKKFLWHNFLEADARQELCAAKGCLKPLWEGTKFCEVHFREWEPEDFAVDQQSMVELKSLFSLAASKKWRPVSNLAEVMKKAISTQTTLPPAYLVNIDLEFSMDRRQVYQIGLAGVDGTRLLDCRPKYSKPPPAPSWSSSGPLGFSQMKWGRKLELMPTMHGSLDAKGVVAKLNEHHITPNTMFVSWGMWHFDLSLLREWLDAEGYHDVLPNNEGVCLLLKEFRGNLNRILGKDCFHGRGFPLRLPFVFPLLFGEDHPLAGRNHNAIVDSQQLALLTNLFFDLCKPVGERAIWKDSEAVDPWSSHKRQLSLDSFFPSVKKLKLS